MLAQVADPIVYDKISKEDVKQTPFLDRQMLYVQDSNGGNYSSNQVVFETQALSSSGRWLDYTESYLSFPVYITASAEAGYLFDGANEIHADYLLGLKSGSHQLIHSLSLDYNGANVIQPNGYVNMLTNYNMVTTFSEQDIKRLNASIFFNPPEGDSWVWSPNVRTSFGTGLCDNSNYTQNTGCAQGESFTRIFRGNKGFFESQKATVGSYASLADASYETNYSSLSARSLMADATQNTQYVNKNLDTNRVHVKRIMASIRLKDIHDMFANLPLLRMANLRLVLNINNSAFTVVKSAHANGHNISLVAATGPVMSLANAPTLANGTNPLMIASSFGGNALDASGGACIVTGGVASNILCTVSVGRILDQTQLGLGAPNDFVSCRWYCPSYTMTPQYVSQYLGIGSKKCVFEDFLCIQVPVAAGANFTQMLTPSLKNVARVIVVPHIAQSSLFDGVGGSTTQLGTPFCDGNFTAPLVGGGLSQLNVRLGGVDVIASGGHRFGYEFFRSQMPSGVNAGLTDGFSSGLINEANWTKGMFQYYTVDCSRRLLEAENLPQSVELTATNRSSVALTLYCFVIFKREVIIDVATSAQLA
jgi:hypothetical protein